MEQLIKILLDRDASIADRDDAAMDLSEFDEALDILIEVASDESDNAVVLGSCGSSIAEIWRRLGLYDTDAYNALSSPARDEIKASFA